jgi:hypothetical protein
MNAKLRQWGRLHSRSILLALQLYGLAALSLIWLVIHYGPAGALRPMGAPILDPVLLLGYVLSVSALSVVGFKQLRSGARRNGLRNLGLAALTGLLGWCAWRLLELEASRWL